MTSSKQIITLLLILSYSIVASQTRQLFWENGNLKSKESPDGQSELYYENGKLKFKNSFVDEFWIETIAYYENGQLEYKKYKHRNNIDLRRNETSYFKNGHVSNKIICDTSNKVITMLSYNVNGQLMDSSDLKTGYRVAFYDNGKLELKYRYICQGSGGPCSYEGLYLSGYKNGQLKDSLTFKNGCPIGTHITFYENGNLKEYQTYLFAEYYNCEDFMRGFDRGFDYRHDNKPPRTGEYHYNWPNNKTREKGEFLDGHKIGDWYFYFSDTETSYKMERYNNDGKKHGEQEMWNKDEKGNFYKSRIELYENDKLKEETDYNSNNKIISRVTY